MADSPKTLPTDVPVAEFLDARAGRFRADCAVLLALHTDVTGVAPVMWGPSLVGFGRYDYTYASGRAGSWPVAAFSPRARDLTVYVMAGFDGREELLGRLGRHRTGVSCLYLPGLADVDLTALRELVSLSVAAMADQRVE